MNLTLDAQQLLSLLVGAVGAGVVWGVMKNSVRSLRVEVAALKRWKAEHEEESKEHATNEDVSDLLKRIDVLGQAIQARVTHTEIQEAHRKIDRVEALVGECGSNLTMLRAVCVGASGRNGLFGEHRDLRTRFEQIAEGRPWHAAIGKYTGERLEAEASIYEAQEKLDTRLRDVERVIAKVVIK